MSELTRTRGPWSVTMVNYGKGVRLCITASKGVHVNQPIASLGTVAEIESYPFQGDREGNAVLVSAAPDLYDAMKVMLAAFCDGSRELGNIEFGAQHIALHAIAKAEGRT